MTASDLEDENNDQIKNIFVLDTFQYTDEDQDGLYTVNVNMPAVYGQYEVLTYIEYTNIKQQPTVLRLTTVIDPEGYIYTKVKNQETRIKDAVVSIYKLVEGEIPASAGMTGEKAGMTGEKAGMTGEKAGMTSGDDSSTTALRADYGVNSWVLWNAEEYSQTNPQITNQTGDYSFLVPQGAYRLQVEAEGYHPYISQTLTVREGSGIHLNIELKSKTGWLMRYWWQIVLIILGIVIVVLLIVLIIKDNLAKNTFKTNINIKKRK